MIAQPPGFSLIGSIPEVAEVIRAECIIARDLWMAPDKAVGPKHVSAGFFRMRATVRLRVPDADPDLDINTTMQTIMATKDTDVSWRFPATMRFLSRFDGMARVVLARMGVGGLISPHIDEGPYYLEHNRFHVGIMGRYRLTTKAGSIAIMPGDVWWFDNQVNHWATNVGDCDRIALIMDVHKSVPIETVEDLVTDLMEPAA